MTKKQRTLLSIQALEELYPIATCSLVYQHPYELLMAVRLSAQCTDARVNKVTEQLFKQYNTLESIAKAEYEQIYQLVKPCGLGKTKAQDLICMANQLIRCYNRVLPDTIEELIKLAGVGRKTANLIIGDIYGKPAIVTDTHCIRICGRIGLTDGTRIPLQVERQLKQVLPPDKSNDFCHRLVHFGREYCMARNPQCNSCLLGEFCKYKLLKQSKKRV